MAALREHRSRDGAQAIAGCGLDAARFHLLADVLRLPQCQRHNGQGGICRAGRAQRATIGNEQVLNIVRLPLSICDAIKRIRAHPRGAHIVRRRRSRTKHDALCANRLVKFAHLSSCVFAHGLVVRMLIHVHICHR